MKKILMILSILLILCLGIGIFSLWGVPNLPYGYARPVSACEEDLRQQVISAAEGWLGTREGDDRHKSIVALYNSLEPLPQGYTLKETDSWCAAFGTVAAMEAKLTGIIPPECGCQRQIALFQSLGRWQEDDDYLPLPGDYVFYAWGDSTFGDCTGWADHVGIVVGTWGPFLKVIEGNKDDAVGYRYILRGEGTIRGYGLPDYAGLCP